MSELDKMKHEPPRTTEQAAAGTTPPSPTPSPNPAVLDEAGSRALSEALRSSFVIVKILMIGLVILFFFSGIFTVPSSERAIVLRFGKPVGTGDQQLLGPGLHWSFPSPIDEVVRIPIGEVQTVRSSAGWYQTTPEEEASGQESPGGFTLNPAVDGYAITSDGNIIHARATVRYRITDPLAYVLNFVNASNVVRNALDNSLFYAASFYTADKAIRDDQLGFRETVLKRVRELVNEHKLGITIESAEEITVKPPRQVREAFDQVTIADIERRKAQDDALAYASRILSTAQGEAAAVVNEGRTEATRLLQQIGAEARYFQDQLPSYEANPEFFQARLHAEAMGRILTNIQDRVFTLPLAKDGRETEVRWQLNPPPRRRTAPADAQAQR